MRVYLTSAASSREGLAISSLAKVEECAARDRFAQHQLVQDPSEADLILFVESDHGIGPLATALRNHPLVRRFPEKVFVYNSSDRPVAHLPGLYASIERRRYDEARVRTTHYLSTHITVPPLVAKPWEEKRLLYSFVGDARNAKVRRDLLTLTHERGVSVDVSSRVPSVWGDPIAREKFVNEYAQTIADSKFVLCPRGLGTSSMRLFEVMRAGVAPVILADQWVPPTGPDWSAFSVFVPESDFRTLPRLLEELEGESERMGAAARAAYDEWFADDVSFHRLVGWCLEIMARRQAVGASDWAATLALTERFWPRNLRSTASWLRAIAKSKR